MDYHILGGNRDGNSFQVVMHFSVPDVNNEAGVNYRTALVQTGLNLVVSRVPFIAPVEQTQLNDGELYEHLVTFNTHPGETLIQKRDRLDALYQAYQTLIQDRLQNRLSYWGYSRDVV